MSDRTISFSHLTAEQKSEFKRLTSTPTLTWPTFCMWTALNAAFFSSYYLCGSGRLPLWVGMLLNSVVGYVAFSVVHDSLHRAISTNIKRGHQSGLRYDGLMTATKLPPRLHIERTNAAARILAEHAC